MRVGHFMVFVSLVRALQAGKPLSAKRIQEDYGVSPRTAKRYLAAAKAIHAALKAEGVGIK